MRECSCGKRFQPNRRGHLFCSRKCQTADRVDKPDLRSRTHLVIPDTQARAGVPNDHLQWIGQYIVERYEGDDDLVVVHLGDHWDMPSLSSYDRGKKAMEGRRYVEDIEAGNRAWQLLTDPIREAMERSDWKPDLHFLLGNHEDRITRAAESDAQLDGLLSLDQLAASQDEDWTVHDFLEPVTIDGVVYAHYFYNPMTGRPYAGENIQLRLKTLGHSFTMGHQQTMQIGMRYVNGVQQLGLVAGACYQHDEDYKGPQANAHWRGIIVKHNVENGSYDPMVIKLDYLCRRFEGHRLVDHVGREL